MPLDAPSPRNIISRRQWVDGDSRIDIEFDDANRLLVVFLGRGSVAGAHALCTLIDELRDEVGHATMISALVDMRQVYSAPLRAQAIIGRWLLTRKTQIHRLAVFGGGRLEMAIARAIMTIAGMGKKAFFGGNLDEAQGFLEYPTGFHR